MFFVTGPGTLVGRCMPVADVGWYGAARCELCTIDEIGKRGVVLYRETLRFATAGFNSSKCFKTLYCPRRKD